MRTAPARRLRLLTLSCVFPNPADRAYGIFVQRRLQSIAAGADVKALAPIPLLDYARAGARRKVHIPRACNEHGVAVLHPRWLYPPSGGAANAVCLFLRLLVPVARLAREWRFDVLDSHFGYPDGIAAAMLARVLNVPFSVTLRGNEVMHAGYPVRRRLLQWALHRAALVITVSERLKTFALDLGVHPDRAAVIPNGVDTGIFYPRDRAACLSRHGLPENAHVVLSAGSLIERKGHHLIVEAIAGLHRRGIPAYLAIAGGPGREGNFEREIRTAIATHGLERFVFMPGAVTPDAMAELMSAADVFCLASSREGWPNVVHEALACGTPAVAADVGAVPDMIPSPRFGTVLPSREPAELEAALERALRGEWDRGAIAEWGRSRSWDRVAAEVLDRMRGIALRATADRKEHS